MRGAESLLNPGYLARLLDLRNSMVPLLDRATQGLYPTGSTFKPIAAEAALATGLITPQSILPCTGSLTVGNIVFHNVEPAINADLNLDQALTISCDTYTRSGLIRAAASSVEISWMIACPRCGWFADVPRDRENAVWAEHQRDPFCADVEPVHAPPASPYRARLCIKGHRRDAFGICWECLSAKAKMPLRARPRHRNRTRRG